MAFEFIEGGSSIFSLNTRYDVVFFATYDIGGGPNGRNAIVINSGAVSNGGILKLLTLQSRWVVQFRYKYDVGINTDPAGSIFTLGQVNPLFNIQNYTPLFSLFLQNDSTLCFTSGTEFLFLLDIPALNRGVWYYFELVVQFGAGSGGHVQVTISFKINGVLIADNVSLLSSQLITATPLDSSDCNLIGFASAGQGASSWITDILIGDSGTNLGEAGVYSLFPDGNSTPLEWIGNYTNINQYPASISSYITTNITLQRSMFTFQNLSLAGSPDIPFVMLGTFAWGSLGGEVIQPYADNTGLMSLPALTVTGTSYLNPMALNPVTSGGWTTLTLNAMTFGYLSVT